MNKLQSDNLLSALCLHNNDNILITLKNLNFGMVLSEYGITMDAPALSGQKIARFDIQKDDPIIKYGTVIGFADSNIKKGQVLTNKNVLFKEFNREHNYCSKYKPTNYIENNLQKRFMGYKRHDGRVGTRNYIAIVSTVNCSATVVHEIASYFTSEKLKDYKNIDGVAAFSHSTGCGMELSGEPMNLLYRTLGGYIKHPNIAATLVVGLGCERCQVGGLFQNQKLDQDDPFVETLIMQENGGTSSTIKAGIEIVKKMLHGINQSIDVIVPRGGKSLVAMVQEEARVPVFAHLEGICHIFVDKVALVDKSVDVCLNAKMRRPGICGAVETILVHKEIADEFMPQLINALKAQACEIRGCNKTQKFNQNIVEALDEDWAKEYLLPIVSIKIVSSFNEAIEHIDSYSSGHTESILTEDLNRASKFQKEIDSAIVMHNTSTQFADGGEFGLGGEIGIATGKFHARGPVGVDQLTSFKYLVNGNGQIRI